MSLRKRISSMSLPSLVVVIWFTLSAMTTNAFNVDKDNVIQYHGDSRTMFGFSVAEHKEQGRSWVVIGAPEMSDSTARYDYRGGAVFYCDAEQNDSCRQIPQTSYQKHSNHDKFDNNTRQWLGATIRSSGENGVILTCAPRYFWFRHNGNSQTNRDPVGTCFLSNKNFANFEEYSPCRNKNGYGHGKQGSCQVGFGAAISKDSKRIYLGAVGSYYWQGQLVSILHTHLKLPYDFEDHEILFDSQTGSAFSQTVYKPPEFMVTKEGPKTADDSWMGYSVASIEYSSESRGKLAGVVAGVPRGDQMVGKVRLLTWNLTDVRNISGEQFASYFGYSIAVADVDGDGADDIIVGAPMYSDYSANKIDIERGRVYVYYQTAKHCELADRYCWETKFANYDFIDGVNSKSRFGLALASLGDINQDGYEDFAVGAPYEGASSECGGRTTLTGAVYIYHGSKNGVRKKFSQVISAIDMSNGLNTFGFSLSGGLDLDNNTYPDLVVGAYESGMVYLFKSRPVIQLEANMSFASRSKMIGLNDNNCWLKNNAHVSCVYLEFCMMYDGVGVPDTITLDVQITLDAKQPQSPRMFFVDMEGSNQYKLQHQLYKKSVLCKKINTYIARLKPNQDKLTPLEAELKYYLVESSFARKNVLTPVLSMDDDTPLVRRDSLSIKNNCGADNICKPNLVLKIDSNRTQYILGSGDLVFNVSVYNEEEDSFGTIFKMKIPPGISYSRFEDLTTHKTDLTVQCYPPRKENNYVINCDIGNPLPSNKEVQFRIILEPRTSVEEAQFDFWANVTTKNPQVSSQMRNQESSIVMPILEETQLLINSESSKSQTLYYNTSQYDHDKIENDIQAGPFVRHEYTIKNLGPSEILEADVVFDWPSQTYSGDDLLYLFAQPKTEGNIKCERVPNVNYHKLQIRRRFDERYTEPSQVLNSNHSTSSNSGYQQTITNSKWGQSGSPSVNQINSVQSGKGSTNVNQNSHQSFDSFHKNSEQNSNGVSIHQNGQQEGQNVVSQSGHRSYEEDSGFHHREQSFNTHHNDGSSHQSRQDGYGGQLGVNSQRGQNNMNSVHESESSYHKSTINDNGRQNTFIDGSWRTNDNGVIKNGSYSSAYPNGYNHNGAATAAASYDSESSYSGSGGASYDNHRQGSRDNYYGNTRRENDGDIYNSVNAHTRQANETSYSSNFNTHRNSLSFFDGQNIPIVTGDHSQMVDANTGSRGTIIHRQRVGDDILTTYDEGIIRGQPEVLHRGTETEDVIRNKSVSVKYGKPIELPEQYEVPKSWKVMQPSLPQRKKEPPPLQDDQTWDTDDEETGDGDGEGDPDEETKGSDESRKRVRRRLIEEEEESAIDKNFCAMSSCTKIVCTIGRLSKDEEVSVIFPAIAWARTIRKIAFNRPVEIGSRVVVNITKLPHIKTPKLNVTYSSEILTNVTSMDYGKTPPDVVPLWIVVTSACLGTLILMLLVFLLYKSGFFKRNRPPHLPERQPLNRNGGYHMGDEQL